MVLGVIPAFEWLGHKKSRFQKQMKERAGICVSCQTKTFLEHTNFFSYSLVIMGLGTMDVCKHIGSRSVANNFSGAYLFCSSSFLCSFSKATCRGIKFPDRFRAVRSALQFYFKFSASVLISYGFLCMYQATRCLGHPTRSLVWKVALVDSSFAITIYK